MSSSLSPKSQGFDLLRLRPLRAILLWLLFPYIIQIAVLAVYVWMAVFGWQRFAPQGVPPKLYAQTNIVNLLIWGLWWPVMIWLTVFFGRIWCMICPLELVSNLAERIGRRLGLGNRTLGRTLQAGWLMLTFFVLLQALVPGMSLHRVPAYTSIFLWIALGVTVLVGLIYKDRAFCRGFCPVELLLGAYARGAMLAVRPKSTATCDGCASRDCTQPDLRNRLDARSCPSLLNPARLNDNNDCLVCGQCVKVCGPANIGLYLRPPFSANDARTVVASWPVTLFLMTISGFVISELCSEWAAAKAKYVWAPQCVAQALGLKAYEGWVEAAWTLVVVPAVVWLVLGGVARLAGGAKSLAEAWRRLAMPLALVIAAGHMAKGIAKFVLWFGFLPLAWREPSGVQTALGLNNKTIAAPAKLLSMGVVSSICVLLVLLATGYAIRELRLIDPVRRGRLATSILLLGAAFCYLVFGWGFL